MKSSQELVIALRGSGGRTIRGVFPLGVEVMLGRDPSSHLVLKSPLVSRKHLVLRLDEQGFVVTDSSANGTTINGRTLRKETIELSGTTLKGRVGDFLLRAVVRKDETPALPANSMRPLAQREIHHRLLQRLELPKRQGQVVVTDALRAEVRSALGELAADPEVGVPREERSQVVRQLMDEVLGLGAIESLLEDPSVSEVMVVDRDTIYVERNGRLELTGKRFTDDDAVRAVIERIVTPLGRRIDESSPVVDARLPDGSRVNAVIPPLALRGPCLTIRKFPQTRLKMAQLLERGSVDAQVAEFLESSVRLRKNIVVSGGTGTGKTTLLGILSGAIDPAERVVTIEDAAELRLAQPHVVMLEGKPPNLEGRGEFTIRQLLKNALRMRPDRIVVGECRGGEALDMLQAMNTGHEGSMTTLHASSARQAVQRLETLCLMADVELPLSAVRRQIASSVHLIVQISREASGQRVIRSVSEVVGLDKQGTVQTMDLFTFDGTRHRPTGYMPTFLEELEALRRARLQGVS